MICTVWRKFAANIPVVFTFSGRFSNLRQQPPARQTPVARDGLFQYLQHGSGLFHAETAEVAQFHDAGFAVVGSLQLIQGVVQIDQTVVFGMAGVRNLAEVDSRQAAAVPECALPFQPAFRTSTSLIRSVGDVPEAFGRRTPDHLRRADAWTILDHPSGRDSFLAVVCAQAVATLIAVYGIFMAPIDGIGRFLSGATRSPGSC